MKRRRDRRLEDAAGKTDIPIVALTANAMEGVDAASPSGMTTI